MSLIYADSIDRARCPEEVGVDTFVLRDFFDELKSTGYRFKNIMVLRHGKVVAECTKYPFVAEMPHTMFSFSKVVTAVAIGFAVNEGLLRMDTTINELFADSYSEKILKKTEGINVSHLLMMTAGKSVSLFDDKEKGDWLDNYMKSRAFAKPGEKFKYISENTYVLGRMLTKVSGQTISEYLRPRLFEPLKIDFFHWDKDKEGFDAGGWGLFLNIEDMAKLTQCFLQGGVWNGMQIIPEGWVEAMVTPYTRGLYGLDAKELGFGFNTWCGRADGYYRFEGLYSQFSFVYPNHDACVVINCSDITHKKIFDLVDKYFPHAFKDDLQVVSEDIAEEFRESLNDFSFDILPVAPRNYATEAGLSGNTYKLLPQKFASMLPLSAVFPLATRPGYLKNLTFDFSENYAEIRWTERNSGENTLCVNLDGKRRLSKVQICDMQLNMLAYGAWHSDGTFEIQIFTMEIPEVRTWKITFGKKKIKIINSLSPNLYETLDNKYRFEGIKTNIILDIVAKISNAVGNIYFASTYMPGKLVKKPEIKEDRKK